MTPERPRPLPDHVIWLIICVTLFHYMVDWMHTVDLGVSVYCHCSVMHELMADDGPFAGLEWKQRLNSVWLAMQRAYATLGTQKRLVNLTPGMVHGRNAAFPALKCKANESRHFVLWCCICVGSIIEAPAETYIELPCMSV